MQLVNASCTKLKPAFGGNWILLTGLSPITNLLNTSRSSQGHHGVSVVGFLRKVLISFTELHMHITISKRATYCSRFIRYQPGAGKFNLKR